jgi:hypothetical protein
MWRFSVVEARSRTTVLVPRSASILIGKARKRDKNFNLQPMAGGFLEGRTKDRTTALLGTPLQRDGDRIDFAPDAFSAGGRERYYGNGTKG